MIEDLFLVEIKAIKQRYVESPGRARVKYANLPLEKDMRFHRFIIESDHFDLTITDEHGIKDTLTFDIKRRKNGNELILISSKRNLKYEILESDYVVRDLLKDYVPLSMYHGACNETPYNRIGFSVAGVKDKHGVLSSSDYSKINVPLFPQITAKLWIWGVFNEDPRGLCVDVTNTEQGLTLDLDKESGWEINIQVNYKSQGGMTQ